MREETEFRPKPMVEVGGRPLLWHLMKLFGQHGLNRFVCCLGYRGADIKRYFLEYRGMGSDMVVDTATGEVSYRRRDREDWKVTLVDTGLESMTGSRVRQVGDHLRDSDIFLCTYGDGLADVDLGRLIEFHRAHGGLATVTGVHPPSRFGELERDGTRVHRFAEKPVMGGGLVSGGFFVFDVAVLDRISADPACVLEREPLEGLARDRQLHVYPHEGFWQCADTVRDVEMLRSMWDRRVAPWKVWSDEPAVPEVPWLRAA
jgi:glucose-1-phosphate cytidylyltransferase